MKAENREKVRSEKRKSGLMWVAIGFGLLVVACGIVFGSIFGVAKGSAKENTTVSKERAVEIAKEYVESNYESVEGDVRVNETDREMIVSEGLKKAYYKYEVELTKGTKLKIDIDIDGRTGKVIFAELDR